MMCVSDAELSLILPLKATQIKPLEMQSMAIFILVVTTSPKTRAADITPIKGTPKRPIETVIDGRLLLTTVIAPLPKTVAKSVV